MPDASPAETMSPSDAAEMLRKAARGLDGAAVQVGSGRPVSVRLGWQRAAQAVTAVADALPVAPEPAPSVPSLVDAPMGTVAHIAGDPDVGVPSVDVVRVSSTEHPDVVAWAEVVPGRAPGCDWWATGALERVGAVITHLPTEVSGR